MLIFVLMSHKIMNTFLCLLLLLTLSSGVLNYTGIASGSPSLFGVFDGKAQTSFSEPCDMDHCNPYMPRCPLCPSPGSSAPYLRQESGDYLPAITSSFILISDTTLSDQGYIRSVFRPPASTPL
jgi:hypothetical protein